MIENMKLLILLFITVFLSCTGPSEKLVRYTVDVQAEYPHDTSAYTQGLFFNGGKFYETTGLNGKSSLRIVDLESGNLIHYQGFDREYFVEGSVIWGNELYVLTWDSWKAFVFDAETLTLKSTVRYPRQGWGITTDGKYLIASDGSSTLFFMDRKFSLKKRLTVKMEGKPVKWLNELEYIDGKIWANVYMTDEIVIINPQTGNVEGVVDCTGLLADELKTPQTDVLNGIAYNPATDKIYITGKNWPKLFEVKIQAQN